MPTSAFTFRQNAESITRKKKHCQIGWVWHCKSVTNKDVREIEQLKAQALMIAELANSMQEQSQKQFKEMIELFKATLDKNLPPPTNPKKVAEGKKKKKCQHCRLEVYHKPKSCLELEANTAKRPVGWMSKKST